MSYCSSVGQLVQLVLEPAVLYYLCVKYITYHHDEEDDFDEDGDNDDKNMTTAMTKHGQLFQLVLYYS